MTQTPAYYMSETEERIVQWTRTCLRAAGNDGTMALAAFEQARRDMRHAGYALPRIVVDGVKAAIAKATQP